MFRKFHFSALWRHQMEAFSALTAFCAGNTPVTGELPTQRPMTRSFDVFLDLRLKQQLSKQWRRRLFETPFRSLWLQCHGVDRVSHYIHLYWNDATWANQITVALWFIQFLVPRLGPCLDVIAIRFSFCLKCGFCTYAKQIITAPGSVLTFPIVFRPSCTQQQLVRYERAIILFIVTLIRFYFANWYLVRSWGIYDVNVSTRHFQDSMSHIFTLIQPKYKIMAMQ